MRSVLALGFLGLLSAQILPDTVDTAPFELQLEDQAEQAPEGIDWTQVSDLYENLARHPVDLNRASIQELMRIPGMTPQLIRSLRAHQAKYGPLLSIYELQAVPGFTESVIRQMRPFIRVAPATPNDLGSGPSPPPSLDRIRELSRFTFIQRVQRNSYYRGDGETWTPETLRSAQGDPYRLYTRLWLQANPYLSLALIGEKDYYEPLRWAPRERYYGYDFLSGHLAVGRLGRLERLVVGDYILQVGQGLVLARGLGFGKGGDPILTLKQPHLGLVPYTSVNEYQFWRGVAATYRLAPRVEATAFYSYLRQDGTIQDTTSEEEVLFVRTLLSSGLHRTPSELRRRKNLLHTAQGAVLTYRHRYTTLGGTFLRQRFDPPLNLTGPAFYQAYNFMGAENQLGSAFWDVTIGNVNAFGEAAVSASGGKAFTSSFIASLSPQLDAAVQVRHFDANFHSFYGYTFAERPYALQNEQGFYVGLRLRPTYAWEITGFYDLYRFPWYRYRAHGPTIGHENLFQITYRPNRRFQVYARLRYERKPYDISGDTAVFYRLIEHTRAYVRLHLTYAPGMVWRYQARIEHSWYERERFSRGYLLYQDVRWQPSFNWSVTLRWVVFRVGSYDARIYTYEAMPPTTFYIPGYYGDGQRWYVMMRWRIGRRWTVWGRMGYLLVRFPESRQWRRGIDGLLQVRYELK